MTGVPEPTMSDDLAALHDSSEAAPLDEVTVRALDLVIDANADLDVWFAIGSGVLEGRRSAVIRFGHRAGVELDVTDHVHGGVVLVPGAEAVDLCRAFCQRERLTVLAHLRVEEQRIAHGEPPPGGERTARQARDLVRIWVTGA
jgi:hypothetical protein